MANVTTPRRSRKAPAAADTANAAPAANLPAIVPGAPVASALPATLPATLPETQAEKPATLPAAHNGAGWVAMLTTLPAWPEMLAEMRAGKYGAAGKGIVPNAGDMYSLTPTGRVMAESGTTKAGGKPTAQAATCRALALALAATGETAACKAAVVYYMLTAPSVLALLRQCKAAAGNGAGKGPRYVGDRESGTPCPAWAAGYAQGNARHDYFSKRS